jgi:hypothetical protein
MLCETKNLLFYGFIICISVLIIWLLIPKPYNINSTKYIISTLDNKAYKVNVNHLNSQRAADTMAQLNIKMTSFLTYLKQAVLYENNPDKAHVSIVQNIINRYNPDNLRENSPYSSDTSYVINKGEIFAMCLRKDDKDENPTKFHDLSVLMFVMMHEISHLAIQEHDHLPYFWETFKYLLIEAENANIYYSIDYSKQPINYCGLYLDYNPRYDIYLKSA